jgi:cytochrome c oxidase cbb3-type subunit 3
MSAWGRAHGGPLDDAMIDILVAYLRSLARAPAIDVSQVRVSGSAERGRALWAEHCVSCHGPTGEGTPTAPSVTHPSLLATASDGFLRHTIEHGREGTPMTGFGALLPSQSIDDLVVHLRTLEHAPDRPAPPPGPAPPAVAELVIHPEGEPPRFELRDNRFVSSAAVNEALRDGRRMVILDARATSDWAREHIPGAAPFPFYDIDQMAESLPDDGTWILAYCACPHAASGRVVDTLRERGFEHTAVIDEGIHHWMEQGYPIERGAVP